MLKKIRIEQFVIIDKLDLDYDTGLTIITGETGAGKSITLDAMEFLLGEESNSRYIREGHDQSILEAIVAPPPGNPVWEFLAENNLAQESDKEFSLYRVLKREGNDEIKVNGKPVDLELLKTLGLFLIEIHGQFANQSIMDPNNQLKWLDMSGEFPQEFFDNVSNALSDVHKLANDIEEEKLFLARNKKHLRNIEDITKRLENVGMEQGKKGYPQECQDEYDTLLIAKETSEALQSILGRMIAGNGIVVNLSAINQTLLRQEHVEKDKVAKLGEHLQKALEHSRGAVDEVGKVAPEYEIDTEPLKKFKEILAVMNGICTENKISFAELEGFYEQSAATRDRIRNGRNKLTELQNELIEAKNKYVEHAKILSEKRSVAAENLSQLITTELAPLKLNKAEFVVKVDEKPDMEWTPLGFNLVTFTARMNPGQPFSPISETASGGELARLILALKVVLQNVQTTPTLVFDEVDTGIGGAAAAAVGDRIGLLADNVQVLVITHSPQVASRGDQHLHISKKTDGVTTLSMVNKLTMDERIDEISRMLAGDELTDHSHAAAKSLIDEAEKAAINRRQNRKQA